MIKMFENLKSKFRRKNFNSAEYWEQRYAVGGNSGEGSYAELAAFKARIINEFVSKNSVNSLIEFGCGDGNQLTMAVYPNYIGLDVSKTAIGICMKKFIGDNSKSFFLYDTFSFVDNHKIFRSEVAMSLDVIYHLVEDAVFENYMKHLFDSADRFVIVYSNDEQGVQNLHEKNRNFTKWVQVERPQWKLIDKIVNPHRNKTTADFYIYAR